MPLYEYDDLNTGRRVELVLPVNRRDNAGPNLRRVTCPQRVCVTPGAIADPHSADGMMPRAFKDLESSGVSAREIERQSGFSREQIKRIWSM
jgi:hypothetical protein